jgi:hypothetical protein
MSSAIEVTCSLLRYCQTFGSQLRRPFMTPYAMALFIIYETQTVILGSRRLDIGVSWRAKPHLHLSAKGTEVYVNVSQLSQDLKVAVAQFEADFIVDAKLRDTFFKSMRCERQINPANPEQRKWQQVLSQAPQEAT